jgi:hypothetical protein
MVRFFAEDDFFLPSDLYELKDMLHTCIDGLELLTSRRGIASEGCRCGLSLLEGNNRRFLTWLGQDKLLPVKFAYLLDKAFQNFVGDFSKYCNRGNPIRAARREGDLQYSMKDGIDLALGGFRHGSLPNLALPASLTAPGARGALDSDEDTKPAAVDTSGSPPSGNPGWWTTNPSPVKEWCIPVGKQYHHFFNPRDDELKGNTSGWPDFPHHKMKGLRPLCVKYQTTGKCRVGCNMSHVKPSSIGKKPQDEITVRLQAIYISGGKS